MNNRSFLLWALLAGCTTGPGTDGGGKGPGGNWAASVGALGTLAQTFDQVTWSQRTIADRDLYAVACYGNLIGWATGQRGFVAHTLDGGQTWQVQQSHLGADLRAVRFSSTTVGLVAGDHGALAVTRDGGDTWVPVTQPIDVTLRGVAAHHDVMFAVGDGATLLRSTDGGTSWSSSVLDAAAGADLRAIAASHDGQVLIADSRGVVWQSDDLGVRFTSAAVASTPLHAISLDHHSDRALAAGDGGTALLRSNGRWTTLQTNTSFRLRAALISGPLFLAGDAGTLLTSTDDGQHWSPVDLGTRADLYGLEDL